VLSLPSSVRIYFFTEPTDIRKGHDGLTALVKAAELDEFSGHLFVFLSRRGDRAKILSWKRGGIVLWSSVWSRAVSVARESSLTPRRSSWSRTS